MTFSSELRSVLPAVAIKFIAGQPFQHDSSDSFPTVTTAPEMLDLEMCSTAIQQYTRQLSPAPESTAVFPCLHCESLLEMCIIACRCSCATANLHTRNMQKEERTTKHTKGRQAFSRAVNDLFKRLNTTLLTDAVLQLQSCKQETYRKKTTVKLSRNTTLFAGAHDRGRGPAGHERSAWWSQQRQRGQQERRGGV